MKRTLWTAAVAGLLAICASNCGGGGDDNVTQGCNKLQTCNALSLIGATTTAECVSIANSMLSQAGSNRNAAEQALASCLSAADCTSYKTCMQNGPQSLTPVRRPDSAGCAQGRAATNLTSA